MNKSLHTEAVAGGLSVGDEGVLEREGVGVLHELWARSGARRRARAGAGARGRGRVGPCHLLEAGRVELQLALVVAHQVPDERRVESVCEVRVRVYVDLKKE